PKGISELREGGFVIRYAIMHREFTTRTGGTIGQKLPVFQIRPVKGNPGELIEEALQKGSKLDQYLSTLDPDETTVSMWVPSSAFADVGPVRSMVARRGFSTAIWARPEGRFIEISPLGSESKAQ